jgi:hypothetical protein
MYIQKERESMIDSRSLALLLLPNFLAGLKSGAI